MDNGFETFFCGTGKQCIKTHRYRTNNPPESLEAKILFDADKLDAAGAIGIARTLLYKGIIYKKYSDGSRLGQTEDMNGGRTKLTEIKFYENVADELLKFAVIISKSENKYVFCKHRKRDTWEIPGGHREAGENIMDTAKRELYEETGALEFNLKAACVYSVTAPDNLNNMQESFGMLFFADIKNFEAELHSEIEKIVITDELPKKWTYPDIQPHLINEAKRRGYV